MTKIKYVGFYNHHLSSIKRVSPLAAINKMDYVVKSLNTIGYCVDLISPAWLSMDEKCKFMKSKQTTIGKNTYIYTPSLCIKSKITNYFAIILSWIWLFFYLIFKVRKDENIIVYHSLWLSVPVYYAKKIKKFNIILEVEEIYTEIWKFPKLLEKFESKIIKTSKSYIIASDLLRSKLPEEKEALVLYGAYETTHIKNTKFNDGFIHLVYAGGIELVRKGAFISIEILEKLPDNYFLNIVGFGDEDSIQGLKECIASSSNSNRIKFHGELKGEEFFTFIYKCDVGLNPQVTGIYMNSAFPSKILTYLCGGLKVISSKVESIYQSALKGHIFFYENIEDVRNFKLNINESLCDNIQELNDNTSLLSDNSRHNFIEFLDMDFKNNLRNLLEK